MAPRPSGASHQRQTVSGHGQTPVSARRAQASGSVLPSKQGTLEASSGRTQGRWAAQRPPRPARHHPRHHQADVVSRHPGPQTDDNHHFEQNLAPRRTPQDGPGLRRRRQICRAVSTADYIPAPNRSPPPSRRGWRRRNRLRPATIQGPPHLVRSRATSWVEPHSPPSKRAANDSSRQPKPQVTAAPQDVVRAVASNVGKAAYLMRGCRPSHHARRNRLPPTTIGHTV